MSSMRSCVISVFKHNLPSRPKELHETSKIRSPFKPFNDRTLGTNLCA